MLQNGQLAETVISGYTSDGLGVCHIDGCAVFVPDVLRGERCLVRVVHAGRNSAHGVCAKLLERSAHRIAPDCPHAKHCGGCALRHMDYEEEFAFKQQRVRDALARLGGVALGELPITGAERCDGYRNKAQYPVQTVKGRLEAGFYRRGSHALVPVERCRILPEVADLARAAVTDWARRSRIPAYDERTRSGLLRHIFVRVGMKSGQVMVCLAVNGETVPDRALLLRLLQKRVPGLASVQLSVNRRGGNVILGDVTKTLWGEDAIDDELCGNVFRLSARSFYQVNRDQAERLYEKAIEYAGLTGTETVLDLYCGAGTITLAMARHARRAVGVELVAEAIEDAKQNAARNGVENAEFFCADAGEAAKRFAEAGERPDVIVVDPPRKGLSPDVIAAIEAMAPPRVVYVSCDPATLARDVKLLTADQYRLDKAEAFDLFPRTSHVETVVLLSRK